MKLIKYLPLLLLGMVFLKLDTSACEDRDAKKDNQKRKTEHLARSAYKALRASTAQKSRPAPGLYAEQFHKSLLI